MTSGGKREKTVFLTRTPTHHLILYELIRCIRHLVQRVCEPLGFHFPPRSREPARHVSHCPRRVQGQPPVRSKKRTKNKRGRAEVACRLRVCVEWGGERVHSVLPAMSWWRKRNLRRGTMSTTNAPCSTDSENCLVAASTMSTRGSSCSLTEYP